MPKLGIRAGVPALRIGDVAAYDKIIEHLAGHLDRCELDLPLRFFAARYGLALCFALERVDLRDLRAVSDWMAADPGFDPQRLAVFGGSYGGFATLLCVTRIPERWRCAVDLFGVSNLVTMIENAQPNWRRFLTRWIGDLERDAATLIERSPITHVDEIRCPMLVIQGANDTRVPQEESDQIVARLRSLGRRVEYVVFPDEGHGFTKRANAERAYDLIVDFLTRELISAPS